MQLRIFLQNVLRQCLWAGQILILIEGCFISIFSKEIDTHATHSSPNKEHDGLHIARAAQTLNPETLKTELTEAGNPSLALESLARMQGFDTSQQHTAYHDAYTALKVLRIIKDKHKENWEEFLKTSTKSSVETLLTNEGNLFYF